MTGWIRTSLALFLPLIASACGKNEAPDAGGPRLVGATTHDFGVIEVDAVQTTRHHRFALTNASTTPFVVDRLVPTCGCVSATVEDPIVPAGGELCVDVTFVADRPGVVAQSVRIVADGELLATLEVKAHGVVAAQGLDAHYLGEVVEGGHHFLLTLRTRADDPPPPPHAHGSNAAVLDANPWELVFQTDESMRWQAVVCIGVSTADSVSAVDSVSTVDLSEALWLRCGDWNTVVADWWRWAPQPPRVE